MDRLSQTLSGIMVLSLAVLMALPNPSPAASAETENSSEQKMGGAPAQDHSGREFVHGHDGKLYRLQNLGNLLVPTAPTITPLTCNVPVTGQIDNPLDSVFFSLTVGEADVIEILDLKAPTAVGLGLRTRLLDGAGAPASHCGAFMTGTQRDCGPLSSAGNPYYIEVEDEDRDNSGAFAIQYQSLTEEHLCDRTLLSCGMLYRGWIDPPVDSDLLGVCVEDNTILLIQWDENIEFKSSTFVFPPSWRLIDRTGTVVAGDFSSDQEVGPLPAAGNPYRIQTRAKQYGVTGDYSIYATPVFLHGDCQPCPCSLLELTNQTIDSTMEFTDCSISAGDNLRIISPGDVTFQAALSIALEDGFSVEDGAQFTASTAAPP